MYQKINNVKSENIVINIKKPLVTRDCKNKIDIRNDFVTRFLFAKQFENMHSVIFEIWKRPA